MIRLYKIHTYKYTKKINILTNRKETTFAIILRVGFKNSLNEINIIKFALKSSHI